MLAISWELETVGKLWELQCQVVFLLRLTNNHSQSRRSVGLESHWNFDGCPLTLSNTMGFLPSTWISPGQETICRQGHVASRQIEQSSILHANHLLNNDELGLIINDALLLVNPGWVPPFGAILKPITCFYLPWWRDYPPLVNPLSDPQIFSGTDSLSLVLGQIIFLVPN